MKNVKNRSPNFFLIGVTQSGRKYLCLLKQMVYFWIKIMVYFSVEKNNFNHKGCLNGQPL